MIHCVDGTVDYPAVVFTRATKATIEALLQGTPTERAIAAASLPMVILARIYPGVTVGQCSSHAYGLRKAGHALQRLSPPDKVWAETLSLRELVKLGRVKTRSAYHRRILYDHEKRGARRRRENQETRSREARRSPEP